MTWKLLEAQEIALSLLAAMDDPPYSETEVRDPYNGNDIIEWIEVWGYQWLNEQWVNVPYETECALVESDRFRIEWCSSCGRSKTLPPCSILYRADSLDPEDHSYPKELVYTEDKRVICTAYLRSDELMKEQSQNELKEHEANQKSAGQLALFGGSK